MPSQLALLLATGFVILAIRADRKRGAPTGLFWPTLWYVVVASRPLGTWLHIWGISGPSAGGDDPTDGSFIDRYFYLVLTIMALRTLAQRKFDWGATLRRNPWITAFVAYMAISIIWSHYPYVSFKRFVKIIGSIAMTFVILSNDRPFESVLTVLRQALYIHLPMSIVCTRYFRDIGVNFEWNGTGVMWQGISTSKNTLGQVAMLGVLVFYWDVRRRWGECRWKNLDLLFLAMAIYLLKGSPGAISLTSLSVCIITMTVFMSLQAMRANPAAVRRFVSIVFTATMVLIGFVIAHSIFMFRENSLLGHLIKLLGRDITMTGRTDIWADVYNAQSNPLLGVGIGGFWIGRIANIPWNAHMTWVLGQAHNGYIDTYLQLGIVGIGLLVAVLITTSRQLSAAMEDEFDFACFRFALFITILFVNIAESTYLRGDHHLWLIMQLAIWMVPFGLTAADEENYETAEFEIASDEPADADAGIPEPESSESEVPLARLAQPATASS